MGAFPHIRYAAKSDIGRKRTNNEDAFGAFPASGLFCVADGMGGGDDGEVASAATVEAVERFAKEHPASGKFAYPIEDIVSGVRRAVNSASSWIAKRTREKGLKSCGSTFAGICFDAARPNTAIALHAGDSRMYRIRGRSIKQITVDHSAAELIGAKNDAEVNPMFRGMILRAVGIQPSVELERTEVQLKARDRILICSDGLSRMVSDRKLLSIIHAEDDLGTAADRLVAAANDAGGIDNITVALIEVGDFPPPLPTSPLTGAAGDDPVPETQSMPTAATNIYVGMGGEVVNDTTTEDDFIPSTAGDGGAGGADEDLNIPESDVEGDSQENNLTQRSNPAILPGTSFLIQGRSCVCRLASNRFAVISMAVALILACCVVACLCLRISSEVEAKNSAGADIRVKEQKDSLQIDGVERKAGQEQSAGAVEEKRTRSGHETPAKRKELDGKARKAAGRGEREVKAARGKVEADAMRENAAKEQAAACREELRKTGKQRQKKESEEVKAGAVRAEIERNEVERPALEEAARLGRLHKAGEAKKRKKPEKTAARAGKKADDRIRKGKERPGAEEKERPRKEAERRKPEARKVEEAPAPAKKHERERNEWNSKEKQDRAINAFTTVVKDGMADGFIAKIDDCIPDFIPPDLHRNLLRAGNPELSRTDQIAAIVALTKDVQQVSRELREYSSRLLEDVKFDLADARNEEQTKDFLSKIGSGVVAFDREAADFIGRDASEPDTQMKCISIIRSVPKWFDF